MNKNLYRLVFSKRFGALVAVAETTVSQGKNAGDTAGAPARGFGESHAEYGLVSGSALLGVGGSNLAGISFAIAMAFAGTAAFTTKSFAQSVLPTGGSITKGSGTITTSGNTMTINQGSNVLGTNWNSFSVGAKNTVIFNQPSSSSIAVNRVIGNSQSQIYGNLQANGQVFLINPNGVMFGQGAQVQVGALVATTKDISDAQISAGNYTFSGASMAGVINQGVITAKGNGSGGGYVVLHADKVTNDGTIIANGGSITLAAGQTLGLSLDNGQLLSVQVTGAIANALVQNKGLIVADGGQVFLTARGKDTLLDSVVNNEGIIRARSMSSKNGVIILDGGEEGAVINRGTLDVSGRDGNKGGTVIMAGQYIALTTNSTVDASGDAGGGVVIIGGDNLNKVTSLLNFSMAAQTVVQDGANIDISSGNGSGGFIETSGRLVSINGNINGAAKGSAGQWLIDPTDITINATPGTVANTSNASLTIFQNTSNTNASTVSNAAIVNALNTTNVLVTTTNSNATG
ncbi:MAG: Two-partner secreted adhesin EtpA, partial [Pseudomonadota bacterium]